MREAEARGSIGSLHRQDSEPGFKKPQSSKEGRGLLRKILAAVMQKPFFPVQVCELEEPELAMNSAMMDVRLSEVCGTDVHLHAGQLADVPYPIIPGHVSVGVLSKIRGNMVDIEERRFHEGDEVTFLDVHRTCG